MQAHYHNMSFHVTSRSAPIARPNDARLKPQLTQARERLIRPLPSQATPLPHVPLPGHNVPDGFSDLEAVKSGVRKPAKRFKPAANDSATLIEATSSRLSNKSAQSNEDSVNEGIGVDPRHPSLVDNESRPKATPRKDIPVIKTKQRKTTHNGKKQKRE